MNWKRNIGFLFGMIMIANYALGQDFITAMNKVKLFFRLDQNGCPVYQITYDGKDVIKSSHLGFKLSDSKAMDTGFHIIGIDSSNTDETWKPILGEVATIHNKYKQMVIHLKQTVTDRLLDISFRISTDGVAFRYE